MTNRSFSGINSIFAKNCKNKKDANFAKSKLGIADGHNKRKQLFIPDGKIGKFQVLGINVAGPCYVLPSWAGQQGRGAFLIPGIPIPSVRDVIASLAFFMGRRERKTINKAPNSYLMFRHRLQKEHFNHTPRIALCRQDNIYRYYGRVAGQFSESYIIHGLSGRMQYDRSCGRLGDSSLSPFFHPVSTETISTLNDGPAGHGHDCTANERWGLSCHPSFFVTRAWIGGVNQFSFRDGRADRTKGARLRERLGVLPARPFFAVSHLVGSIIFRAGKAIKACPLRRQVGGCLSRFFNSAFILRQRPYLYVTKYLWTGGVSNHFLHQQRLNGGFAVPSDYNSGIRIWYKAALLGVSTMFRTSQMGATATGGGRAWFHQRCCHRSAAFSGWGPIVLGLSAPSLYSVTVKHAHYGHKE